MPSVRVKVLYFGQARDAVGKGEEELVLANPAHIEDAVSEVLKAHERLFKMKSSMQISLNEELTQGKEKLSEGDEIAFLPPVAGG